MPLRKKEEKLRNELIDPNTDRFWSNNMEIMEGILAMI